VIERLAGDRRRLSPQACNGGPRQPDQSCVVQFRGRERAPGVESGSQRRNILDDPSGMDGNGKDDQSGGDSFLDMPTPLAAAPLPFCRTRGADDPHVG
jgi:hypothetical protein